MARTTRNAEIEYSTRRARGVFSGMNHRETNGAKRDAQLLWAIVVLAAVLRFVHIGAQSLWIDEYLTLEAATPKSEYSMWEILRHNIHGPLHAFVVFLFRAVSVNDGWLRVPSALAGIATVPLLFVWIRPRFGARAALWGALLLAVNPLHVHYSQELRNYAFAVLFVLAGAVGVDRMLMRDARSRVAALAACVAAAILSNFSATFSFVAHGVSYFKRAGVSRRTIARGATVLALVVILTAPWIYRVTTFVDFGRLATPVRPGQLDSDERLRGETTFRFEAVPYAAFAYSVGFTLGPSLRELHGGASMTRVLERHGAVVAWVAALFGSLLTVGVVRGGRAHGRWALVEPVLYVVIPLVATLALNWQNAKAFNVRYVLVGLPMYLALVAVGIASLRRGLAPMAGALVALTCGASLANYYFNPAYAKEDVRSALRAVEARLAPGECILAPTVWQIVGVYATGDARVLNVYSTPESVMQDQLATLFVQCDSFWYLRARPWVDDPEGRVLAKIDERYVRGETLEFPGVSAIHFSRKP